MAAPNAMQYGDIYYGDKFESENRILAARLIKEITTASDLENRGVLLDTTTGRNDYRCASTNQLSFYRLDENINNAPYRLLLEIGDNVISREILQDPAKQKIIGQAIKRELVAWLRGIN